MLPLLLCRECFNAVLINLHSLFTVPATHLVYTRTEAVSFFSSCTYTPRHRFYVKTVTWQCIWTVARQSRDTRETLRKHDDIVSGISRYCIAIVSHQSLNKWELLCIVFPVRDGRQTDTRNRVEQLLQDCYSGSFWESSNIVVPVFRDKVCWCVRGPETGEGQCCVAVSWCVYEAS